MNRLKYFIFIPLFLLPPIMMIFFIKEYGLGEAPLGDELTLTPFLQKMYSGNLSIADFLIQNNEHRTVFPLMIVLLLAKLTHWNMWYELYMNWILVGLMLLFIYLLLRRTIALSHPSLIPYLMIIFSFLVFSPAQWGNWIAGFTMTVFLSITATVAAVWAITQWQGQLKGVIIAIIFSFISTFSLNNGFLSWILIGGILLMQIPRKREHIILIVIGFVISVILYYHNYTWPSNHPLILSSHGNYLKDIVLFVVAFIGSPLGIGNMLICIVMGIILISIFCYGIIRLGRSDKILFRQFLPWFSLGCYSLISATAIGVARLKGFGLKQAITTRYINISTLLSIAVVIIIAIWIEKYLSNVKTALKTIYLSLMIIILIIMGILIVPYGKNVLNMLADRKENIIECWENIESAPDEWLRCLNDFNPASVREPAKILKELGLIRVKPLPPFDCFKIVSGNNNSGAIETLYKEQSQTNLFKQDNKIVVKGWVSIPAKYVIIVSQNKVIARAELKENKQDWKKRFNSFTLPKGISEIRAYAVLNNEKDILLLENGFIVDVE